MKGRAKTKKVYFYRVEKSEDFDLNEILFSEEVKEGYDFEGKTLEVNFIENQDKIITGTFVVTKISGIPPKHKKRTNKYSSVEFEVEEGLSYPNVFLYDPENEIFFLEFNRDGAYPSRIQDFLGMVFYKINKKKKFTFRLLDILTADTYKRINNFDLIRFINFKVAYPNQLIADEIGIHGSVKEIAQIGRRANASSSMEVSMTGDISEGGLSKNAVLSIIDDVSTAARIRRAKKSDYKVKVEGVYIQEDQTATSDVVDLFLNKLKDTFELDEPLMHNNIQHTERKREILRIYRKKIKEIKQICNAIEA